MTLQRASRAAAGAALASAVFATGAFAAHPIKGATYSGTFGPSAASIAFKVSPSGKRVSHFMLGALPLGCQGGGFGSPQPARAKVSKHGTFKVTLRLYFAPSHSYPGKLIVTGKFLSGGREQGKISSKFNSVSNCDASDTYSTTG